MKDDRKTKKQLISELEELRQRIANLEGADPERFQNEDALRESERRYRNLFHSAMVSLWEEDYSEVFNMIEDLKAQGINNIRKYLDDHPDFVPQAAQKVKIIQVNDQTLKLYGVKNNKEMIKSLDKIFLPETVAKFREQIIAMFEGKDHFVIDFVMQNLQGERIHAIGALKPPSSSLEAKRVVVSLTDVTERLRIEQELEQKEARLAEAQRVAHLGSYEFEVPDGEVIWSEETFRILERDPSLGEPSIDEYLQIVHPEDRSLVENIVARTVNEKQPFDFEYRVIVENGQFKYIQSVGEPVMDENGTVVRLVGTIMDITDRVQAENALRENERQLKEAQEIGRIGRWEFDIDTQKITWSDQVFKLYERDPTLGEPTSEEEATYYTPEDFARLREYARRAIEEGKSAEYDFQVQLPSGKTSYLTALMRPITDESGRVVKLVGTVQDITERKLVEDELKIRAEILDNMAEGVNLADESGTIFFTNPRFETMFGYRPGELIGKHVSILNAYAPDENAALVNKIITTLKAQGSWSGEFTNLRKDDTTFISDARISALDVSGKRYLISVQEDITERKRSEEALRESERRLKDAQRIGEIGDWELDVETQQINWSEQVFKLFERNPAQGPPTYEENIAYYYPEDSERLQDQVRLAMETGVSADTDYRLRLQSGKSVWHRGTIRARKDENGRVVKLYGTTQDITERKQAEEELEDIFSLSPDMVGVFATEGNFLKVNPAWEKVLGYSQKEILDLGWAALVHPDDVEVTNKEVEKQLKGSPVENFVNRFKCKDGSYKTLEWQATYAKEGIVHATARDITERMLIEDALRESEERYRKISVLTSDFAASYWIDPEGTQKVEWATEAFLRITGYSPEEIAAGGGIVSIAHPEDKEILEHRQRDLLTGKPVTSEYRILTKSGEVVWLRDYALSDWGVPEGRVVRIYGAAEDITGRKKAKEELEDTFNLSPNMIGVFTTEGKFLKVNPTWEKVLGYSQKELFDLGWAKLVHPDDVEKTNKEVESQLAGGSVVNFVNRYKCKDDSYRTLEWQTSFAKEGIVHAAARDITERLASERALEQSEIRYRSLFENMLNGFIYCKLILDNDGEVADVEILEVNEVFETKTGISREQVRGMKLSEVVPGLPEANPELFEKYAKAVLAGENVELEEYISPLDQWVHVLVFSPEEGYAVVMFEDITQRKHAEMELKQNAERMATLREIDQAILAAESPSDIAKSAIDQLGKLVGAERISVTLFDFLDDMNIISSVQVRDQTEMGVGARIPLRDFVMGEELEQGLVHRVDEIEALEHPSPVDIQLLREGVKSYINIPLMVQNKLTGSLNLGASEKGAFTEGLTEIACEVADSLAIALQQARLFEQVKVGRDRLQLLSRRLVEGQEAERRYIAQELHDEVGQVLTSLKLSLQMNKNRLPEEEQIEFKETEDLIDVLLKQVRDLSLDLRPAMLDDLGLLPALLWQVERFEGQTGIEVTFEHSGLSDRHFLPEIETAAYRIVQEALTNVARHAQVTNVEVHTHYGKKLLTIEITDEGVGFDVSTSRDAAVSLGLVGMEERATMLGGSIKIESVAGKGTNVRAELPLGAALERRGTERVK